MKMNIKKRFAALAGKPGNRLAGRASELLTLKNRGAPGAGFNLDM